MEKKYELRNPNTDDMFLMFRILSKIGVKNVKDCFRAQDVLKTVKNAKSKNDAAIASVGMTVLFEIVGVVLEHIDDAKEEIYAFLSRLSGLETKEIAEMEMADFAQMIIDVVKMEGFRDFFTVVSALFR